MIYPKKYFPINWIEGMKLSQNHFIENDHFIQDFVRDSSSLLLNHYNFGILPPPKGEKTSIQIELTENVSNNIEVQLTTCEAVTSHGCRISINRDSMVGAIVNPSDVGKANLNQVEFDLILMVDPFFKTPFGEPNPIETPLRHPYSDYRYELQLVSSEQVNSASLGGHYLVVGKIVKKNDHFSVNEDFIPPSCSIESHPKLIKYYRGLGEALGELQNTSTVILRKMFARNIFSEIGKNTKILCEKVLEFIAGMMFEYRNMNHGEPPIVLIRHFAKLANVLYVTLYTMPNKEKEEMLTYFYKWANITPGDFEKIMVTTFEIEYNHNDIQASFKKLNHFVSTITSLWIKLSTLEYIGQVKENIVVREEQHAPTQNKTGWNILD